MEVEEASGPTLGRVVLPDGLAGVGRGDARRERPHVFGLYAKARATLSAVWTA